MKKIFSIFLTACMIIGLTACSSSSDSGTNASTDGESITIKFPHAYPEGHPVADVLEEYFKTELESRSDGRIKVELYPNAVLATEEKIYEGLRNNTYEMGVIGNSFQDVLPSATAIQLPFLFEDLDHAKEALVDNEFGYQLVEGTEEIGFDVKSIITAGFRIISSNKKLETLDDFQGLKLRMPNYENMVKLGETLGCAVTPMSTSEIFSALEQGVIDGQENPASTIRTNGWYEVQDYILVTNHVFTPLYICTSNAFFDSLSEEDQELLMEVIEETTGMIWDDTKTQNDEDLAFLEGVCDVSYPSDELQVELEDATAPLYDEMFEENPEVEPIVESIKSLR